MNQNDHDKLCSYFRRNRYDIIQARQGNGWGPIWTFAPCDVLAARRAAKIMRTMERINTEEPLRVRHARRARLRARQQQVATDVVVLTILPERGQEIIGLEDGFVLRVDSYLQDDALAALEAELAYSLDGAALR